MEKPADNQYPIHELLKRRWSPRAFANRMIDQEKLQSLLEAARWASSSRNAQPWHFIVATGDNPSEFDRLFGCLSEGNQRWAKTAPVLMLSVAELFFDSGNRPNAYAYHDVGLAVANLVLQATAFNLSVHQMAGFNKALARERFGIPEGFEPVTVLAIGYLGERDVLSDDLRERELAPRVRKPLESFVFGGRWGQPTPLFSSSG